VTALGALSRCRHQLSRLTANQGGVTMVEFALIAPVFLMLLLGLCDIGQRVYAQALLSGAVRQAARSSSLETGNATVADAQVEQMVLAIAPGAKFKWARLSYYDFADLGRREKWTDANGDGTCSKGEAYEDENRNGRWDADIGKSGNGGAGDVVIYTVNVTYPPLFGVPLIPGGTDDREISASVVRKNQPFADQARYGTDAGSCP
jgi:Flp pilus assembly pilin Flp